MDPGSEREEREREVAEQQHAVLRTGFLKFEVLYSTALLILFLIFVVVGGFLLEREQDARVREAAEQRQGLRILFVDQCREIEALKADLRAVVEGSGVPPNVANRFEAKPGGCGEYPPPINP